jgi:hypothetical protein
MIGLFMCFGVSVFSQDRTLLRGKVMYRDSNVINENVLNVTAKQATITNENGEFEIMVALGDELVFTAVNYKITAVLISQEILDNNRLVVSVDEKVTALEEVVVGPENTEKFLALKNERFKGYDYEIDRSTEVDNIAEAGTVQGLQNGLNFANIFRLLFQNKDQAVSSNLPQLKLSEVIRQLYEDRFFIEDLQLSATQIEPFLYYLDAQPTSKNLFKKENEFQLIDFLVNQSQDFLKTVDD